MRGVRETDRGAIVSEKPEPSHGLLAHLERVREQIDVLARMDTDELTDEEFRRAREVESICARRLTWLAETWLFEARRRHQEKGE